MDALVMDSGNAAVKARFRGEETVFPHALLELTKAEWQDLEKRSQGDIPDGYVMVNNRAFSWGETAEGRGVVTRRSGAARYEKGYYDVLVAIAMSRLVGSGSEFNIFGSHAPRDAEYADDLVDAARGHYEIIGKGGEWLTFDIVMGTTFDEPLGGLSHALLSDDGRHYRNQWLAKSDVICIDIGGYTTDFYSAREGQIDYSVVVSEPNLGINGALKRLEESIRREWPDDFKGQLIPPKRLRQALRTGGLEVGGREYAVEDLAAEASSLVLNRVCDLFQSEAGGRTAWDGIVVTGGGGALLLDRMVNDVKLHDVIIPADEDLDSLHLANVRGGAKLWNLYMSEEVT